jgi:hypothetical protein
MTKPGDGFSSAAEVVVRQVDKANWEIERGFEYGAKTQVFRVMAGEKTDFASVPRVVVWLFARYGTYTLPAILHDHLYRVEVPAGHITYPDSDGIFRRAMRERGVTFLTRWCLWSAVRTVSFGRKGGFGHAWADAPRALLLFVPGIALVAPGAVTVGLTLLLVKGIELFVYPFLLLGRVFRRRTDQPVKAVNAPTLRKPKPAPGSAAPPVQIYLSDEVG